MVLKKFLWGLGGSIVLTVIYVGDTWNIGDGIWRLGILKMVLRKMVVANNAMSRSEFSYLYRGFGWDTVACKC